MSLNISASGNPVPKITWSLQSGTHYNQSRFNSLTDKTFEIEEVRFEDQGMITCQAENLFGTRVAQVKLIVFGEFVVFFFLSGDINEAILLYSWRFSFYSAPIHWLAHGHMTSNNTTVSRQIP